jgi:phosphoglycerol transferase MdoB-like AlkP superfamily enzyme
MSTISRTADRPPRLQLLRASGRLGLAVMVVLHAAAFIVLWLTEHELFHGALSVLAWGLLNCAWLMVLRRPGLSAALSLIMVCSLILLSQFKTGITWVAISFLDFLIVDPDTVAFLFGVFPQLRLRLLLAAIVVIPLLIAIWRFDPFRVRRRISALAGAACLVALSGLSLAVPEEPWEPFQGVNHISNFVRSGVTDAAELFTHGWLEADAAAPGRSTVAVAHAGHSALADADPCHPPAKRPHIVMVLDESSFDVTAAPGIKVPPDYGKHFRSFDGKQRSLLVEATGGPTWYAEYSVLTGLTARSFGRFKFHVTRIAAGRVERGLPRALQRCGYKTFTLYPDAGDFLSARRFQETVGIDRFVDARQMGAGDIEPDRFYFDQVRRTIERERAGGPLFIFSYVTANHFPWTTRFRPELTPEWKDFGNPEGVDEYIRRQTMSAHDYADFLARLRRDFPDESFLVIRFGDHQPWISTQILEPGLDEAAIARKIMAFDPRYFTTYYAIDAVNFTPVDVSSALDTLDAAYLPLLIQEAAGLPLDASFAEQKKIMRRCNGLFYPCAGGAEVRRLNRMLIDAGLIKGL